MTGASIAFGGTARHFAPFRRRQTMAETVRRRLPGGTSAAGRHASASGPSTAQKFRR